MNEPFPHAPIIAAAHAAGARVFIDAVALAPHQRIDIATLGCDALVTSPYKWYAPHSGVIWMQPDLLQSMPIFKVRPSEDNGPRRFETGMPNYEGIAGTLAATDYLMKPVRPERLHEALSRVLDGSDAPAGDVAPDETIPVELGGVTRFVQRSTVR